MALEGPSIWTLKYHFYEHQHTTWYVLVIIFSKDNFYYILFDSFVNIIVHYCIQVCLGNKTKFLNNESLAVMLQSLTKLFLIGMFYSY